MNLPKSFFLDVDLRKMHQCTLIRMADPYDGQFGNFALFQMAALAITSSSPITSRTNDADSDCRFLLQHVLTLVL